MNTYFTRSLEQSILLQTSRYPVVVVTGPRQVGKTSLVKAVRSQLPKDSVYLDLEYPPDLAKLANPTTYLESFTSVTVIIDEVQRKPELFPLLRALVDRQREPGRFILLGSASPEVIRDTSESLAGRVAYLELSPFLLDEITEYNSLNQLWVRGGFPESFLSRGDESSIDWRDQFIQSYLERDLPLLGLSADPQLIRNLWTMLAHSHGQLLNLSTYAKSLGITVPTVNRYMSFLESSFMIRILRPFASNLKKRLVKSPKVFIRDSGILHALLNIPDLEQLMGHPIIGNSWEGFIIQQLFPQLGPREDLYFVRTKDGAEIDVLITSAGRPSFFAEIKFSDSPSPSRGFYNLMNDLELETGFLICPTKDAYPFSDSIKVIGPNKLFPLAELTRNR